MKTRIISGLIAAMILLLVMYVGGPVMYAFGAAVSLIALNEFHKAVAGKINKLNYMAMVFTVLVFIVGYLEFYELLVTVVILFMLSNFLYLIAHHQNLELKDLFANVFAFFYIVPSFFIMMVIRDRDFGLYLVMFIFISSAATDTFAYFVGKAIGKHKLAPKLSPNKTIEGAIGGTVVATAMFVAFAMWVYTVGYKMETESFTIVILIVVGLMMSVLSQLGDLSASAIKRITGIKDYGHLIPGHGGILDRFDSALFTAPGVYVVLTLLVY